ncbi:MAG: Valine-tRNA ligase [Parcubacteria group bacterium GW2011_GWA2_43_9b]|nr:MAG: Valine-tRNA ligase [Parcubacteria group bacterium GW2011_GWA2_43_9b]
MTIDLSQKYNREDSEKRIKDFWEQEGVFKFDLQSEKPLYIVDTPPPYVSADHLHSGHIMSYAQAEFIVRYKRMRGYNVFYPMGFDDNGLPTERYVEKKYKIDKSKITKSEFIKICLKETEIGSQTYKKLWNDLGISVDWSKTYSSISPTATKVSQWSLIDLYKKGALYRAKAPVLWCPNCKTAIAQADLEDQEEDSKMNYINFKSVSGQDLTIATTRPELLPACVALYVNPNDERFKKLIGSKAIVPLFDYEIDIKASDKVDMETGTGLMMVCTWGDKEDLEKWQVDNLETRSLINEDGTLNELGGKYQSLRLKEARKQILEDLKSEDFLIKQEDISHAVNVHERCGTPAEFIQSKQWFIKIADKKDIWLKYGKELNWHPKFKEKDYELWVNSIKWDWCISRQRYYGVPFPIWYCSECEEPIFAEEKDLPVYPNESQPNIEKCPKCGNKSFVAENDVMDTWATSSCTPFLLRELVDSPETKEKLFPVTLRPNAFEIIRTWDFYSIVKSHYHFNSLPFTDVMISGHGVDEKGVKFSKRLGNYILPEKIIAEFGADALRYWATGAMLGKNLRFSVEEIKKGLKTATKLWNVARFVTMSLDEVSLELDEKHLEPADLWIIGELNKTQEKVTKAFDEYTYAIAKDELDTFFWSKFADYYIEFVKYRIFGDDHNSKKTAQQALLNVFLSVLKMYAPILPFITEEIYLTIYKDTEKSKSIHISNWPSKIEVKSNVDILDFSEAIEAIDEIRKYKSENNISLGKEIEDYKLKTKVNIEKYGDFIKKAIRVKKIQ